MSKSVGLVKRVFHDDGSVTEIRAHTDGIRIECETQAGETVLLTPTRVAAIVEMAGRWWQSHWHERYEREPEGGDDLDGDAPFGLKT